MSLDEQVADITPDEAVAPSAPPTADWYKDAVIYQTHVKAFFDANGDGIGDFEGLIAKLDYIQELGVSAIWLLPFYPSPLRDDGYDIADYRTVHPAYGALKDDQKGIQRSVVLIDRDAKVVFAARGAPSAGEILASLRP